MKKFKKIMAVLVAAMMIVAMTVPAWAAETHTVTFDVNGGNASVAGATVNDGDDYTLPAYTGSLTDYTFVGWSLEDAAAGTLKTTVKTLKDVTADTDVHAIWNKNTNTLYSIEIDNALVGETYNVYKIFDVSYSGTNANPGTVPDPRNPDNTHQHTAYAYTINSSSKWWNAVTGTAAASDYATAGDTFTVNGLKFTKNTNAGEYNVEFIDGTFNAATFATTLNSNKASKDIAVTYVATDTDFTLYPGDKGYYFVDTTMGSLCSLDTTEAKATIREKNTMPTLAKKISESGSSYVDEGTFSIGDTIYYELTLTDGIGTDTVLKVHDNLDAGITLNVKSFSVKNNSGTDITATYYNIYYDADANVDATGVTATNVIADDGTIITDGCTFEIHFTAEGMSAITDSSVIKITYTGKLNNNATIGNSGNDNTAWLTYSEQTSTEVKVPAYTYAGALYKYSTAGAELADAVFTMTDPQLGNRTMYFVQKQAGDSGNPAVYQYDSSISSTTDGYTTDLRTPDSGAVLIYGLEDATYTLTEKTAPSGYYPLTYTPTLRVYSTDDVLQNDVEFTTSSTTVKFVKGTDDKYSGNVYQLYTSDSDGSGTAATNVTGIENKTGSELPSTGGMGTTVLYIVGGMLVILAGAYLFFSRKKTA